MSAPAVGAPVMTVPAAGAPAPGLTAVPGLTVVPADGRRDRRTAAGTGG